MKNTAFGLPKGTVRAVLALALIGATIAATFIKGSAPDGLLTLSGAVVAWYFKRTEGEEK